MTKTKIKMDFDIDLSGNFAFAQDKWPVSCKNKQGSLTNESYLLVRQPWKSSLTRNVWLTYWTQEKNDLALKSWGDNFHYEMEWDKALLGTILWP